MQQRQHPAKLDPRLRDICHQIQTGQLGPPVDVSCEVAPDGDALLITDRLAGEMVVTAEAAPASSVDVLLALRLTPPLARSHSDFPTFVDQLTKLTSRAAVILLRSDDGADLPAQPSAANLQAEVVFAAAVRLLWVNDPALLLASLESRLGILRQFYADCGDTIMRWITDAEF
jgi:hypothetical protein